MSGRAFADSNILIYAIEENLVGSHKAAIAREVVDMARPVISTQVLGEFYNVVTGSRRADALSHSEAQEWIAQWKRLEVQSVTVAHVDLALEIRGRFRVSYYDALILAAAKLAGCSIVYSEDMSDGQDYGGVRVVNPFALGKQS